MWSEGQRPGGGHHEGEFPGRGDSAAGAACRTGDEVSRAGAGSAWGEAGGETGWGQPVLRAVLGTSRGQPLSWISLSSGHFNSGCMESRPEATGQPGRGRLAQWARVAGGGSR